MMSSSSSPTPRKPPPPRRRAIKMGTYSVMLPESDVTALQLKYPFLTLSEIIRKMSRKELFND